MIETEIVKLTAAIESLTKALLQTTPSPNWVETPGKPHMITGTTPDKLVVEKPIDQVTPPTEEGYTLNHLKEMAKTLSKAKALAAVVTIVKESDIARISECPPEKIQQVGEALQSAIDALPKS
jgi:hypothetical protein